jgi:divalent metal cation (Fe/Co/Zn/Cd) transporter
MAPTDRETLVRRGRSIEYFTIGYNLLEGFISIGAGVVSGSVYVVGFGLDSRIEVTSGAALLWRLRNDSDCSRRERAERAALRIAGACLLALAAYVGFESADSLLNREMPERSLTGIAIAALSLMVMPVLARAKRRVAAGIGSAAMHADSRQTDFCTYLSAILLTGLVLHASLGWWWADAAAGLAMVPIIAKEGADAWRGKTCCGC